MRIVLALGGNALLHRGEHPYPLDALNAQTQGLIGYWLVRELDRALGAKPTAALMTRVWVDRDDPAFAIPSKFVGESYGEGEAHALSPHTAGRWRPRTGCRGAAWSAAGSGGNP